MPSLGFSIIGMCFFLLINRNVKNTKLTKMKYKYLSLVILTYAMICMISCQNRKNYLMTDVIEIDNSEQNLDTLVGRNIGFDYMGVNNV